jgi:RND family efflux transporter MFP subunit
MKFRALVLSFSLLTLLPSHVVLAGESQPTAREVTGVVHVLNQSRLAMTEVLPGSIVPDQQAKIASRLMGYIRNLNVQVGQSVKEGQLLFAIDPTDINGQIRQAQSATAQARAALADAKADYDRFSKLYKQQSVSQQQFDKVKLQYQVAQENLSAAEAGLDQAKGQMRYADVKAPFDGVVVQKLAVSGDLAAPGNPILILENRNLMSVQVEVSSELYRLLKLGDNARVILEGRDEPVKAVVSNLVTAANPITRTHTVKLSMPVAQVGVNSGAFARVAFNRGERETLLIPSMAVIQRGGVVGVFVVGSDHIARFRMVRTGANHGDMTEIQAGLDVGEQILVSSQLPARNGDRIVAGGA